MVLMVLVCWGMVVGKSYGQNVPTIEGNNLVKIWDRTFGGIYDDIVKSVLKTDDGGFIISGFSSSPQGGDKSQSSIREADIWLVKIDKKGNKEWDRTIGGKAYDFAPIIKQTKDGGYIIGANSNSDIGGDKTQQSFGVCPNGPCPFYDYWLIKIDKNGNKIWDRTYGGNMNEDLSSLVVCKDGGFLLGGTSISGIGGTKTQDNKPTDNFISWYDNTDYWVVRVDSVGNKLWDKTFGTGVADILSAMIEVEDGFLLTGNAGGRTGDTNTSGGWLFKINKIGTIIWSKSLENSHHISNMILDNDNNIFLLGDSRYTSDFLFTKTNNNGDLLWEKKIPIPPLFYSNLPTSLLLLENNTIILGISDGNDGRNGDANVKSKYSIFNVDTHGNILWYEVINLINPPLFKYYDTMLNYAGKDEIILSMPADIGTGGLKSEENRGYRDYWILKLSINRKVIINRITGNIYNDLNTNCQLNPNETGLKNILVRATPGNYNTFTDDKGNYTLYLDDIGTYTVTPIISTSKKNIITSVCNPNSQTVSFTSLGNIKLDVNFGLKAPNCANLSVDIASNRRRRCFRNFTTVKYANEGYLAADNVQLKVIYPKYVVPICSSTVWTSLQDSVITYNLGRLEAGQTGQIVITDSVVCGNESIRGLTQCTKAIISPKSSCVANNPNWDKADLQAFSQCVGGNNAKLSVINTGEAMRDSTVWRLFLNGVLKQQGKLKLGKGENYSFEILAKGNTIRLEADQTPNHPVGQYALTTIERCGGVVAFNAILSPPSVQLPININASGEEIATSCMPIIDSYDPNDKQVIPAGVGTSNIVRDADELEFQVRFQNTGSDTAYTVIIRDTLSTALDIASLQVGASSHNYTYTVSGKNNPIITWTFDKINLPAQKQNDLGSNGFVKFKIAQIPNNAKGTKIKNKAGIYFDFNSPIITNETNLTVGDLVSDLNNAADLATIFLCNNKPQSTSSQAGTDKITASDSLVLSANLVEKGTGIWKVVQGTGVFTNASNPKTTVKKIGLGENIYEWSVSLCNTISASKVKIIKVATPKVEITTKGDTLMVGEADSYQWFLNGQAILGATSQSFIAKTNGTYTVEIKKFGVTVISPAFKHTITGIEDELLQKYTTLIPNPAQNTCVLQASNDYFGEVKLSISNLLGQIVFQTVVDKNETNLSQTLDLQSFANGIYFVYLQTEKGKLVKKLVKM